MSEFCRKEIGLFGVSASAVRDTLEKADLRGITYELAGNLAVTVSVIAEGENGFDASARADAVVKLLNTSFPDKIFTETHGTLWNTVVALYKETKRTFSLAESCTGGLIAKTVTDVPGASEVFPMGVVSYSVGAKEKLLSVSEATVKEYGVVSKETAAQMAEGARRLAGTDVGLGVTGYAGPDAGDEFAPRGTVFLALSDGKNVYLRHLSLTRSDRAGVRRAAALHALDMLRLSAEARPDDIGELAPLPVLSAPAALTEKGMPPASEPKKKLPWYKRFLHFFTDFPHDSWKEKLRKIILVLALGVMLFAAFKLGNNAYQNWRYDKNQEKIGSLIEQGNDLTPEQREDIIKELEQQGVDVPPDVENWALLLLQQNPDTVGRVVISTADDPTYLDQIVVKGKNNSQYLRRSFFGDYNTLGCVFMDSKCDRLANSPNTILYGHSTQNSNKMFNKLQKYKSSLDFLNANPIVTYYTLEKEYQYKIFAVSIINCDPSDGEIYTGHYEIGNEIYNNLNDIAARSLYNTNVDVKRGDRLLTLSTCTFENNDLRLVIMARRVREGEDLSVEPATKNKGVLQYDRFRKGGSVATPTPTGSPSSPDVSSTPSEREELPNTRFEVYDTVLTCGTGKTVEAYIPYYSNYGKECNIGIETRPKNGTVTVVSSDGTVTYRSKAGFTGTDTFTVSLTDESLFRRKTATVTVYVGEEAHNGVLLEKDALSVTVKAGESGQVTIGAASAANGKLRYEILPEGRYSGTVSVSENGTVCYTSTDDKQYRDFAKVLIRDEDGFARLVYLTVNPGKAYKDVTNPNIGELVHRDPTPTPTPVPVIPTETPPEETVSTETPPEEIFSEETLPEDTISEETPPEEPTEAA